MSSPRGTPNEEFEVLTEISKGKTSTVYFVQDKDNKQFALKVLTPDVEPHRTYFYERELVLFKKITPHPNLANLIRVAGNVTLRLPNGTWEFVETAELLEPFEGGELSFHLMRFGALSTETARTLFMQLLSGLLHFQKTTGCCHRDLKPWNICFNKNLTNLKIIDFGQATPFDRRSADPQLRGFVSGTKAYMAPELNDLAITDFSKVDTFALGVILVNMLTGLKYVQQSSLADEFSDPALVSLLKEMLEPDFRARIELQSVLDAPWLQGPLASEK